MTITNEGKNRIRDLISSDVNSAELGTSSTAPSVGDTSLGAVEATTNATPTVTTGNKIVNTKHILLSTIGSGTTFNEFGVKLNADATFFARVVFPDYDHTSNLELHTTHVTRIQ
jgi:hypothetical protein